MEVYIRGVPERVREKQLEGSLRPILTDLGILEWDCQKRKGKPFGFLTFLNSHEAEKFLDRYGQLPNGLGRDYLPPGRKNVLHGGIPLFCSRSTKPPDPWALKSLEMASKTRQAKATKPSEIQKPSSRGSAQGSDLEIHSMSCGLWDFVDSHPVFISYRTWDVQGKIKLASKKVIVRTNASQRIDVSYSTVHEIVLSGVPNSAITLTLTEAPKFFRAGVEEMEDHLGAGIATLLSLTRGLSLRSRPADTSRTRLSFLDKGHALIAGSCLVYRFNLGNTDISSHLKKLSRAHGLPPAIRQHVNVQPAAESYNTEMNRLLAAFESPPLPFAIKFQVQRLAQDGFLSPKSVLAILPEIRALSKRCNIRTCVSTLRRLFQQLPYRCFETDPGEYDLNGLQELIRNNEMKIKTGEIYGTDITQHENLANIHKVTITPAGMYLSGPEPESNNRVLRKYPEHHDCFIRLQFCDEDGEQIRYQPQVSLDELLNNRFKRLLNEGFGLAGLHFSFLGFSHSSLRAQSCWFMAPFVHNGSLQFDRMVIQELGDFSSIRCPAKCAARIGQAFSDTPTAVTLAPEVARVIPDVERNGRVFSDGVGTMSQSVLDKIWSQLPATKKGKPRLFQIRYRGAKGMIVLDSRLSGDVLCLRRSMIKFPGSNSLDLEICDGAYRPLPYFLNQQSIKILEDMGVDDKFFFHHQAKEVQRLRSTTSSSKLASKFLKRHSVGDRINLSWFISKLDAIKLSFQDDKFLRDVVEIAVLVELRALKYKARIPVEQGYTLFGIMDETGVLEEGQVFCIVEVDGEAQVITGRDLIITRAPALHPGDIQIAEGVAVAKDSPLMHLRNCICFSQKGTRDLPSKLSGGDLDGDLYQVLFDPRAQPKRVFLPADYSRPDPVDLGRTVVREDMTDFFVTFMATDQLGRIANNHKILADQRLTGTRDVDCLTLAEMHSTAVDFSKSGIPVDLKKMPRSSVYRPDFMAFGPHVTVLKDKPLSFSASEEPENDDEDDTPTYKYYPSDQILGKLFRAIDESEVFQDVQKPTQAQHRPDHFVLRRLWEYVRQHCELSTLRPHIDRARGIRDEYEDCVRNIAWDYSPEKSRPLSEREVFIGNILGKTGAQSKRQHDLSVSMKEQFSLDLAYTVNCMVKEDDGGGSEESLERSAACFAVSLEKRDGPAPSRRNEELVSFRYVAAAVCLREIEKYRSTWCAPEVRVPAMRLTA